MSGPVPSSADGTVGGDGPPKQRTVAVPRIVVEALEDHLAAGYAGAGHDGAVFVGPLGHPVTRRLVSDEWRDAVDKVDSAPAGLHLDDLRHRAATLMARMPGVTTKELMAGIGHSTPRAALIYQHATAERDEAIASFLDAQIAAASSQEVVSLTQRRAKRAGATG